jgi:GTP-binding protein SAR1
LYAPLYPAYDPLQGAAAGLDNAGKTTLLHRLRTGEIELFVPTQRALDEELVFGGLTLRVWDVGGHQSVREEGGECVCV